MDYLPGEILELIFDYFDVVDIFNVSLTCNTFADIIRNRIEYFKNKFDRYCELINWDLANQLNESIRFNGNKYYLPSGELHYCILFPNDDHIKYKHHHYDDNTIMIYHKYKVNEYKVNEYDDYCFDITEIKVSGRDNLVDYICRSIDGNVQQFISFDLEFEDRKLGSADKYQFIINVNTLLKDYIFKK